jgi:hypothetical protein
MDSANTASISQGLVTQATEQVRTAQQAATNSANSAASAEILVTQSATQVATAQQAAIDAANSATSIENQVSVSAEQVAAAQQAVANAEAAATSSASYSNTAQIQAQEAATSSANAEQAAQSANSSVQSMTGLVEQSAGQVAAAQQAALNAEAAALETQNKSGTIIEDADWWNINNPILDAGILGYDKTNKITKMGDGIKAWIDLSQFVTEFHINANSFETDNEATIQYVVNAILNGADPMQFPYRVGDQRNITLSTNEVITFEILGIQHDDMINGNKAPYTLGMKNLLSTQYSHNVYGVGNIGGWNKSKIRIDNLPIIFSNLPIFWQNIIKTVIKKASVGGGSSTIPIYELQISEDKLFLFAEEEIYGISLYGASGEGFQYEYWATNGGSNAPLGEGQANINRVKRLANGDGAANTYWFRSPYSKNNANYCAIGINGGATAISAYTYAGVCFGFCI